MASSLLQLQATPNLTINIPPIMACAPLPNTSTFRDVCANMGRHNTGGRRVHIPSCDSRPWNIRIEAILP